MDQNGERASRAGVRAIVLAGDRSGQDPVARHAGVARKCLAPVGGQPMVLRVLNALEESEHVTARTLCGPERAVVEAEDALRARVESGRVGWIANAGTPSLSAGAALASVPDTGRTLITTADHALLTAGMVDCFLAQALSKDCDLAVAICTRETITAAHPGTKRTFIRLRGGAYCGCNLFAFLTPRARRAAAFWRRVERQRKKPARVIGALGWLTVLRYLAGRLTLARAVSGLSERMGVNIAVVPMPFPDAAVDVDSVADLQLVEDIIRAREN